MSKLNAFQSDLITKLCLSMLVNENSKLLDNPIGNCWKKIQSENGDAFILRSNPESDISIFKVLNRNSKQSIEIKLSFISNNFDGRALSKIDKKTEIIFSIRENLDFLKWKFEDLFTYNHSIDFKQLTVKAQAEENIGFIHRWIDSKNDFQKHCNALRLNYDDYEIKSYDSLKEIEVKIEAEFINS